MATVEINVNGREAEAQLKRLEKEFKNTDKAISSIDNSTDTFNSKMLKTAAVIGGVVFAFSKLAGAFSNIVKSSFDYNIQMDASASKLNAIISSAKGWETTTGRQVSAMERSAMITKEVTKTMGLLKKANAETTMGMTELIDVYSLMKPGMDRVNVATKDQIKILKLVTNAAGNFGMSSEELATGIDDLATGTWQSASGFGKMAKAIGITKEEVKNTTDLVGYLENKLKDAGKAQDNWATATSNFGVAWDELKGNLTKEIFNQVKDDIKWLTDKFNKAGPESMQFFADALVDMVNGSIKALGLLLKSINFVVAGFRIALSGYQKLIGFAMGGDVEAAKKKIAELNKEKEALGNQPGATLIRSDIRVLEQQIAQYTKYNKLRADGDKAAEEAAAQYIKFQKTIGEGMDKFILKKKKINEAEVQASTTGALKNKIYKNLQDAATKGAKAATKAMAKEFSKFKPTINMDDINKALEKSANKFKDDMTDIGLSFADSIANGDIGGAFKNAATSFLDVLVPGLGTVFNMFAGLFGTSGREWTRDEWQQENNIAQSPESKSIVNLLGSMDWSLTRNLKYSRGIYDNLSVLVENAGKAAVGIAGSGLNLHPQDSFSTGGFLGFSSKDIKNLETSLTLQMQSLDAISAFTKEVTQSTKTSLWGLKKKTTVDTVIGQLSTDTLTAIEDAYKNGRDAIYDAARGLGIQSVESIAAGFKGAEAHTMDLVGKSSDEISQMIAGAISSDLDSLAKLVAPWIANFQKAGEAYLETMGRVTYEIESVDYLFGQLGGAMKVTGYNAATMSEAFLKASNGIDSALSNVNGYIDNFYSESEKQMLRVKLLSKTGIFETDEKYKAAVEKSRKEAEAGNEAAAKQLAELLRLQSKYRDYYDEVNRLEEERLDKQKETMNKQKETMNKVVNAWLGNLSYLSLQQKTQLASGYFGIQRDSQSALQMVEAGMKTAQTREEYIPLFNKYINALENDQTATLDDVVGRLDLLVNEVKELEETQRRTA